MTESIRRCIDWKVRHAINELCARIAAGRLRFQNVAVVVKFVPTHQIIRIATDRTTLCNLLGNNLARNGHDTTIGE